MRAGPSRPTLYEVGIGKGRRTMSDDRTIDYLRLFCTSASIPGLSHDTFAVPGQINHGITRNIPYMNVYGNNAPLVFEVIENTDWSVYKELTAMYRNVIVASNTEDNVMRANYFDSYKFEMYVHKLEFSDVGFEFLNPKNKSIDNEIEQYKTAAGYKKPVSWKFINCYLTSISEISLSSEDVDQALTFRFGIMYDKYNYQTNYVQA